MSKCKGCGKILQNEDINKEGYTKNLDNKLCERCFKIKHYNYVDVNAKVMSNDEIISAINKKEACTFFLCDFLNLNEASIELYNKIKYPKVLIVTKIDILPTNIDLEVLRSNIKKTYNIKEVFFVSSLLNKIENKLFDYIQTYQKILVAGPTSCGKSTFINKMFNKDLTVSNYKNTTLEFITLKEGNLTIIDAPGFNNPYFNDLKLKGNIKPRTLILKKGYELVINDYVLYLDSESNITIYLPKSILATTRKIRKEYDKSYNLKPKSDLVLGSLGFIYFKDKANVYINSDLINIRESLVARK